MFRIRRWQLLRTDPTRYKVHFRFKLNQPSTWGLLGDLAVGGVAVTMLHRPLLLLDIWVWSSALEFCDEKTPLVKDWAYYINWVVEDQILLSAQKQTQNRLETQIRLRKRVGTRLKDQGRFRASFPISDLFMYAISDQRGALRMSRRIRDT